jgi:hypothetical protein
MFDFNRLTIFFADCQVIRLTTNIDRRGGFIFVEGFTCSIYREMYAVNELMMKMRLFFRLFQKVMRLR